jgi:hypothetical protein
LVAPSNDALRASADNAAEAPTWPSGALARLRPAIVPALIAFAVLVHLPIFGAPRFLDDYNQVAMIEGTYPSHPGPFNLYDFITDANRRPLMELGILPWWSHPSMELRFLRPLSSALLWLDHAAFGAGGVLFCHLHSFFWWALACWAVFALVRELFSRRVALVAALIFAVAPCHGFPLSWMANREELISTSLGTLGLLEYVRWRARRDARNGLACFALFATAILCGEYTLCFAGYLLAIEVTLPRESIGRRLSGLACFGVPALAYLVTRHALHYGAFGTGYYHDPLRDFGAYAASVPRRLAVLLITAWVGVDDRLWVDEPAWKLALVFAVTAALLTMPVSRALAALDREQRRRAVWLLLGSVLAIAPVIAVGASVRLLEIPMVGVSAAVAVVLDGTWFPRPLPAPRAGAQWAELIALALAFVHLVRAPLDSWLMHRYLREVAVTFDKQMTWLHDNAEGKAMVIVVRANLFQTLFVTPLRLDGRTPARDLTFGAGRVLMLRTAPRSLEIVSGGQPLFPVGSEDLVRNSDAPLHPGDTVELPGMRATVLALRDDGTPRRLGFEFDRDLDDPSYLWVAENSTGFEEVKLPAPGHGEPLK